jgi:hypothetical protein
MPLCLSFWNTRFFQFYCEKWENITWINIKSRLCKFPCFMSSTQFRNSENWTWDLPWLHRYQEHVRSDSSVAVTQILSSRFVYPCGNISSKQLRLWRVQNIGPSLALRGSVSSKKFQSLKKYVRFEVFTAVTMRNCVFWVVNGAWVL